MEFMNVVRGCATTLRFCGAITVTENISTFKPKV